MRGLEAASGVLRKEAEAKLHSTLWFAFPIRRFFPVGLPQFSAGVRERRKEPMLSAKYYGAKSKPRRKYDDADKRCALELLERGDRAINEVARELGLTDDMLYR